jgi:Flp pilus assembly protein TadB
MMGLAIVAVWLIGYLVGFRYVTRRMKRKRSDRLPSALDRPPAVI